jgi:RNA polymerase sigma factor (TIGR02999 family)
MADAHITTLLVAARKGDRAAAARVWERVEPDVRAIAARLLRRPKGGPRLGASTVVNEVYWRLFQAAPPRFENRAHLLGAAARVVRRILVEGARRRRLPRTELDLADLPDRSSSTSTWDWEEGDLEALDHALRRFELDPDHARKALVVHLRFFAGRMLEEIASELGLSVDTVKRDLRFARAWLQREVRRERRE